MFKFQPIFVSSKEELNVTEPVMTLLSRAANGQSRGEFNTKAVGVIGINTFTDANVILKTGYICEPILNDKGETAPVVTSEIGLFVGFGEEKSFKFSPDEKTKAYTIKAPALGMTNFRWTSSKMYDAIVNFFGIEDTDQSHELVIVEGAYADENNNKFYLLKLKNK